MAPTGDANAFANATRRRILVRRTSSRTLALDDVRDERVD
jgi:hypothetical protein